jgi:hypothetical protein
MNEKNLVVSNENVVVDAKPNYNKNSGESVIKLQIRTKVQRTEKNSFNTVKVLMHLPVFMDGVYEGIKNRWVDVKFKKDAFKFVSGDCNVHSVDDLTTGFLYVKAKSINAPLKYEIKVDDESGELIYPTVWIRGSIVGFEPYCVSQSQFDYVAPVTDVEIEPEQDVATEKDCFSE